MENLLQQVTFSIHSNDEANIAVATRSTIRLAVSMVTTARQHITLAVDYGNHNTKHYSLAAENGTMIGGETETEKQLDFLHVTSSYGNGCHLNVELDHKYSTEGDYRPVVTVNNTLSNASVTVVLPRTIHAQYPMRHAAIYHPHHVAVNANANFSAVLTPKSRYVNFVWIVERQESDGPTLDNVTTATSRLTHAFAQAGHYRITLVAWNRVSQVEEGVSIDVHAPITGLTIQLQPYTGSHFVRVGDTLTFTAVIATGTEVTFMWDFHDPRGNSNQQVADGDQVANYTFHHRGEYNVSVKATNPIGSKSAALPEKLIVQEPVAGLEVVVKEAIVKDSTVTINVKVMAGSQVYYEYDKGDGRVRNNVIEKEERSLGIPVFLEALGRHVIVVYAVNDVSETSQMVEVLVQLRVPAVSIAPVGAVAKEEYTVFVAKQQGKYDTVFFN